MEDGALYTKIEDEATTKEIYTVKGRGCWELVDPLVLLNELNGGDGGDKVSVNKVLSECDGHLLKRGDGHHFMGIKEWYKRKLASRLEGPPKIKQLRKMLSPSWNHSGAASSIVFTSLSRLPVLTSPVVALKALLIVHRLLQLGSRDFLSSSYARVSFLKDIGNAGDRRTQDSLWKLISSYACALVAKLTFHNQFPDFESNYSVEMSAGDKSPAVQALQKMQEGMMSATETGLCLLQETPGPQAPHATYSGTPDSIELIAGTIVSLLKEADLIYDITGFLLASVDQLSTDESFAQAVSKFEEQHKALKQLYEDVRKEPAVGLPFPPPALPEEPLLESWRINVKNESSEQQSQQELASELVVGGVGAAAAAAVERFTAGWFPKYKKDFIPDKLTFDSLKNLKAAETSLSYG